jgi:hypothetical protein|tara:strand:- start:1045 stop:1458 length:414 start_codon:yes stop_codon:yes gene_type:complete
MNSLNFEGLKVALKQDSTGYVLTLRVHPDELPEEILRDFVGARYMIAMVRVNDDETLVTYKNKVKKAGMVCKNRAFWEFLRANDYVGNEEVNEDIATKVIYEVCGIDSRTQLNGNKDAQTCFDNLMKEYEDWNNETF